MQTTAVSTLTAVLPALAALQTGSMRHTHLGRKLRVYREESVLKLNTEQLSAIQLLVESGLPVRVYSGGTIYTPTVQEGKLHWSGKASRKFRSETTVEVVL